MNRRGWMIGFHWATAMLVAASFVIAWTRDWMDDLAERAFWLDVHRTIGLAVLGLTLARLMVRRVEGAISRREDLPLGMWIASRATHALLYTGLIAMPLLGWAQSSARTRHFAIFGMTIPSFVGHDRGFAETLGWWHTQLGWSLLGLIGLHALAALYHHCIRRDDIVRAMVPKPRLRKKTQSYAAAEAEPYDIAA